MRNNRPDPLPASDLPRAAAREIVVLERERLPNLSGLVVLLPNFHAADAMGAVLCEAAGMNTLLLPRMTTLLAWSETQAIEPEVLPDSCRAALLYQALRARKWFADGDLWHISRELLGLFDDMARQGTCLPASQEEFVALLEQAYRARAGVPLQFEARLVHELWYAMSRDGDGRVDGVTAYHLRLARLAEEAAAPLYAVGLAGLTPMERDFFRRYGEQQPVRLIGCDEAVAGAVVGTDVGTASAVHVRLHPQGVSPPRAAAELLARARKPDPQMPHPQMPHPVSALLHAAWPPVTPEDESPGLRERAASFARDYPDSPLSGRLALFEAHSLEQEAQAVAENIRDWLHAGKASIAVIAQDRLVARRARALLERSRILVEDETGWTFSTVSASAVVMRWLDAMASRFHHLDLLDLLKSPLIFADWDAAVRKRAVYGLEQLVRRHSVVSGLHHYRGLAQREEAPGVLDLLARLERAQAGFGGRRRPLSAWLASLLESLDVLGLQQGLQRDLAGEQLLRLLVRLQRELGHDQGAFTLSEWRRWLDAQLEAATFRDTGIVSPVVFTHLGASRLRRFDGVIVAGGDAAHFPGRGRDSVFFNQSVRMQLGLPTAEQESRQMEQDFTALLASCGTLLVTWQGRKNAEPNLASPWIERLEAFHELAYEEKLKRGSGFSLTCTAEAVPTTARTIASSRPELPPELVPAALSASGYNSLMACPYQFYARYALRLNELDEVRQGLEKKDYGEHIHAILHTFHRRYPAVAGVERAELEQAL
ncbi:MAG: PD-(D/E)XK nuclease family protein, partial [Sulfuricella sp.]|nr:PD-(D/E)XK nuclease family protein [Sulfuricella sp.]